MVNQSYDFLRHFELAALYEKKNNNLLRLSDWNNTRADVITPRRLIIDCHKQSLENIEHYNESSKLSYICDSALESLNNICRLPENNQTSLHFFGSATQAIFATLFCLNQLNKLRLLVLQPSYYTVPLISKTINFYMESMCITMNGALSIDVESITKFCDRDKFNAILLTDPIYTIGKRVPATELLKLIDCCDTENVWLVIDAAFGRMAWHNNEKVWIDRDLLSYIRLSNKIILIESPAKRLFVNGMKLGVVFACNELVLRLREYSDFVIGNLSGIQAAFSERIYSQEYLDELQTVCTENTNRAVSNFILVKEMLSGSSLFVESPDEGFHCLIMDKHKTNNDVDPNRMAIQLLDKYGIYALPTHDFFFSPDDAFGLRMNLMLAPFRWHSHISRLAAVGFPT